MNNYLPTQPTFDFAHHNLGDSCFLLFYFLSPLVPWNVVFIGYNNGEQQFSNWCSNLKPVTRNWSKKMWNAIQFQIKVKSSIINVQFQRWNYTRYQTTMATQPTFFYHINKIIKIPTVYKYNAALTCNVHLFVFSMSVFIGNWNWYR
jgi:hypothetical protein